MAKLDRDHVERTIINIVAEELTMEPGTQDAELVVGKRKSAVSGVTRDTKVEPLVVRRVVDRMVFELGVCATGNTDSSKTVNDLVNDVMNSQ